MLYALRVPDVAWQQSPLDWSIEQGYAMRVGTQTSCQLSLPSSCRWCPDFAGNIGPALQYLPAVLIWILQSAATVFCAADQMVHPAFLHSCCCHDCVDCTILAPRPLQCERKTEP